MKKAYLFGLLALAMGFSACDDIADAPGKPQTNPQEPVIAAEGFEAGAINLGAAPLNLETLLVKDEPIAIAEVTALPDGWADDYAIVPRVYVGNDDKFTKSALIDAEYKENKVYITPTQLEDALVDVYGYNPILRTPSLRIAMYARRGNVEARIGGVDKYFASEQINVNQAIKIFVDNEYYLMLADESGKFDPSKAIKLDHDDNEGNEYDNPVFNTLITTEFDNQDWLIVPASTLNGQMDAYFGAVKVLEDKNMVVKMTGDLAEKPLAEAEPGHFMAAGDYRISVNMIEKTYAMSYAYTEIYLVAKNTAWSPRGVKSYLLKSPDYTNFTGFGVVKDDFRFMTLEKFNAKGNRQIGFTPVEATEKVPYLMGELMMNGTNVGTAPAGLVYAEANLVDLTAKVWPIANVGVVGGFQGWKPGEPDMMTSKNNLVWTAEIDATGAADLEYKFVFNKSYDLQAGKNNAADAESNSCSIGGNPDKFVLPAPGKYVLTLDLSKNPAIATAVAK